MARLGLGLGVAGRRGRAVGIDGRAWTDAEVKGA